MPKVIVKIFNSLPSPEKKEESSLFIIFFVLIYIVLLMKFVSLKNIPDNFYYGLYSFLVIFYVFLRFSIAFFYNPKVKKKTSPYEPTLTFGIPAKNEGANIKKTILDIAKIDYPKKKFRIIAIDDGSTDNTYKEMLEAKRVATRQGVSVTIVHWKKNQGKRAGMATAIRLAKSDLIVFIDSDSFIEKNSIRHLVQYFVDKQVGAVAGHAYVANVTKNILTRMQAARYFVAFKSYKAAEAIFGTVTCCSGCCSAYRRSYLLPVLKDWEKQQFLGVQCTYGDDRSLTNALLRQGYETLYAPDVVSYTIVPETFPVFMKQQLRWKKSWFRETLLASSFMWKRNILISFIFYLGFILPLLAPFFVFRAFVWLPVIVGKYPVQYVIGLLLMSTLYALYYYLYTKDRYWIYGITFSVFYTLVLIWQLPWAILTIKDTRWGTR